MAGPTALLGGAKDKRYSPRSVEKWYWIDRSAVAGATPTRAEIVAGTDMSRAIAAVSGFTESSNFTEVPDVSEHKTGKILDGVSLEDGTINFYGARDGADASAFFAMGDLGYVLHLPYGDTAGLKYDLFTVEVGSVSASTEISGAKQVAVMFGLNDADLGVALPA
jgi:hypothetical protein